MQLDDVVSSTVTGPRVEEAMYRCVCVRVHTCAYQARGSQSRSLVPFPWGSCLGPPSRSIRWLDRCIAAHQWPDKQNLFAIIQGGLDADLRATCLEGRAVCW